MKNFFINLLFSWATGNGKSYEIDDQFKFMKTICDALNTLLWPILIIVASVGSIYSIFLGINMAKAEDTSKRDEARKRLINTIIAMAITIVIILFIQLIFVPNVPEWLGE